MDTRDYLLPQRRHRVWGVATLKGKNAPQHQTQGIYSDCLKSFRSNQQFPQDMMFPAAPKEKPRTRNQQDVVTCALNASYVHTDVFVDVSQSKTQLTWSQGASPCLTTSHAIYSTGLQRFLNATDMLNIQGIWPEMFSSEGYAKLVADQPFAQSLAGDSFSATVNQSVLMSAMITFPGSWASIGHGNVEVPSHPMDMLRRIKGKRKAPEYDAHPNRIQPSAFRRKKCKYARKVPGIDSRKEKGKKGKRPVLSIWDKEALSFPQSFHGPPLSINQFVYI